MMSLDEVKWKVQPDWKYFLSMDLTSGYYQVPLEEGSKDLTTFIVPQGRFCFNVLPMGMKPSSDYFNPATKMLEEGEQKYDSKIVDNVSGAAAIATGIKELL